MSTTAVMRDFSTAVSRWAGLGPYYAMFPVEFAFEVINEYSSPGDAILDPFAGRASSVYAAAVLERSGHGIEINPVGWLYGQVKLQPAPKEAVLKRIEEVGELSTHIDAASVKQLPPFFLHCYAPNVLNFLLAARCMLKWKKNQCDATVMAIILVNLHGKRDGSLSNQMRQGKSMAPNYSIEWWKSHDLIPPAVDPIAFLSQRIEWRYAKGTPNLPNGTIELADSTTAIRRLAAKAKVTGSRQFDLLFTSPPYYSITNYHYDQWLRLWMLGGSAQPGGKRDTWRGKFESQPAYRQLLQKVFSDAARVLKPTATVYVRTDARPFTYQTTVDSLCKAFPDKRLKVIQRPFTKDTQTALFGDKGEKPGEIDLILQ